MNNEPAYSEVAARFSDLWRSIRHEGTRERSYQEQQDLINQIRNALDRKLPDISGEKPDWIADSFAVNVTAYQSETTLLLQLRHRDLGSLHALKTVPPARRDDTVLLQRLWDEAEIGLALRHPCIVETSALLRLPDGRPGLLQPWFAHSLASIISAQPIAASQAIVILRRVLQALSAVHAFGYVHCDVTPANILLSDGKFETARLGDFGIALQIGQKHAEQGLRFAASAEFAPPEQMQGAPAKPDQDIYAVGRLARRLIETDKAQSRQGLADFAQACCHYDPALRPQSAMEALQLL
ncbi:MULTISPECIES: protein kinase domain-containing protein [Rhizobium/Agrobacterium group]|uniref:protein kinase domain-containing protein n=1 Tax=Rhizobium/Agrobacterium group TaxID=227290 RepID=UPI0003F20E8D|nr:MULTISPECIES: protein kinase [Rhizobium/Agrobacterium group]AHK04530.1 serine/threonine-protein kinase ImpN involved in nitrogen fixation [Agrobacterium tumefaciens LBA4213 (Ach5)]AKC10270.1 type VI secretion system protein ImpN [Agrobacterium tumefaciens]AYM19414.1 type VI secretion system protein ImpN [Agrobacterium tumefaciens]AYM70715.1 type VI secretion system protein ImpN [Agrobacterium tumefaciens]NIB57011.1 protein kinase [Agrobacterium tumefaciens]